MQRSSHEGKHGCVNVSRLDPRHHVGLKIRNQFGCFRIAAIGAVAQKFEQALQEKQITERQRLIFAGRRHVAGRTRESGKDFARGIFAVAIEFRAKRWRPALGDRAGDPSGMLIGRRVFWLRAGHRAASTNQRDGSAKPRPGPGKVGKSTPQIPGLGLLIAPPAPLTLSSPVGDPKNSAVNP